MHILHQAFCNLGFMPAAICAFLLLSVCCSLINVVCKLRSCELRRFAATALKSETVWPCKLTSVDSGYIFKSRWPCAIEQHAVFQVILEPRLDFVKFFTRNAWQEYSRRRGPPVKEKIAEDCVLRSADKCKVYKSL